MNTVTNEDYWLHIVRNPWGYSEDCVRDARLNLSDAFEKCRKELVLERQICISYIEQRNDAFMQLAAERAVSDRLLRRIMRIAKESNDHRTTDSIDALIAEVEAMRKGKTS